MLNALEGGIALSLVSGRARRFHKAEGERILTELMRRTPTGRAVSEEIARINSALSTLAGRRIESVRVGMRTLGHFTLSIETEEETLTLVFKPDGVFVESVGVGG